MRSSLLSKDFPRPALKSSIPSIMSDTNSLSRSSGRVSVFDVSTLEASIQLTLGAFKLSIFRLQRRFDLSHQVGDEDPTALPVTVSFRGPDSAWRRVNVRAKRPIGPAASTARAAYIFSESNLALGRWKGGEITHVTVYAPAGFGPLETSDLEDLREVCGSGLGAHLTLPGLGQPEDFGGCDAHKGKSPMLTQSRSWVSRTPFIPTSRCPLQAQPTPCLFSGQSPGMIRAAQNS